MEADVAEHQFAGVLVLRNSERDGQTAQCILHRYLWQPEAFLVDEISELKAGVAGTSLNKGNLNALTVKLDQALKLVTKDDTSGAIEVLTGFTTQVTEFTTAGKLSAEQSDALLKTGQKVLFNLGYWQ